jgi:hypothetical protein
VNLVLDSRGLTRSLMTLVLMVEYQVVRCSVFLLDTQLTHRFAPFMGNRTRVGTTERDFVAAPNRQNWELSTFCYHYAHREI